MNRNDSPYVDGVDHNALQRWENEGGCLGITQRQRLETVDSTWSIDPGGMATGPTAASQSLLTPIRPDAAAAKPLKGMRHAPLEIQFGHPARLAFLR
jgi:hypothetical protein